MHNLINLVTCESIFLGLSLCLWFSGALPKTLTRNKIPCHIRNKKKNLFFKQPVSDICWHLVIIFTNLKNFIPESIPSALDLYKSDLKDLRLQDLSICLRARAGCPYMDISKNYETECNVGVLLAF